MDMEGNDSPLQDAPRGNSRREFVPKRPPRRRQRGALPRLDEQQHGFIAKHPTPQRTSTQATAPQGEQLAEDQRKALLPPQQTLASLMRSNEEMAMQSGLLPKPRGPMAKRQNTAHCPRDFARGAVSFSRSWHRASTQEQLDQSGSSQPPDGHTYWSRQRGAIFSPQDQSAQALSPSFAVPPLSQGLSNTQPFSGQNARNLYPFLETKASFEGMWHQLESAIQCREGMLMNMKAEMEKCVSVVKSAKVDALKEKEEAEARKAAAMDNMESINKQTGRIKGVRESLEQISTDLSVQVAELNLLLQQVQERERVLELLESLKEHYDASVNESRNHMDKSLEECEAKLETMEKELECSKKTSELLEKAALEKICDLEEIETGRMLSNLHRNTDMCQTPSMMQAAERPPGLNESGESLGQRAMKLPKLEPV